jgi:hypothetical protein
MRTIHVLVLALSLAGIAAGQKGPFEDDLRALTAAGKIEDKSYVNRHAGFVLRLPQTPCDPHLNAAVDYSRGTAALLLCNHVVKDWGGMYTLGIFVDGWGNYAQLATIEQYVRGLRRLAEHLPGSREKLDPDMKLIEAETPRTWAGLDFSEVIYSHRIPEGTYYQGATCTHLKAYALCFKAEGASVELVRALLSLDGKFEVSTAPSSQPGRPKDRTGGA